MKNSDIQVGDVLCVRESRDPSKIGTFVADKRLVSRYHLPYYPGFDGFRDVNWHRDMVSIHRNGVQIWPERKDPMKFKKLTPQDIANMTPEAIEALKAQYRPPAWILLVIAGCVFTVAIGDFLQGWRSLETHSYALALMWIILGCYFSYHTAWCINRWKQYK